MTGNNDDLDLEHSEAPLSPDQVDQVEAVMAELQGALAELGQAYTENRRAYTAYSESMRRLKTLEQFAETAQLRHDRLMNDLAKSMNLPPGEWIYDRPSGTLKKE